MAIGTATPKHPGDCVNKPLVNDYVHNGHYHPDDPQFRWNGGGVLKKLTPEEQIERDNRLRAAAPKSHPTFFEKAEAAKAAGVALKPSVVIMGTDGTRKIQ
jgi:hypothetical protein